VSSETPKHADWREGSVEEWTAAHKEEDRRRGVAEDAGPPLEAEVDSGTVYDEKMHCTTVRGEAPASRRAIHVTCLRRLCATTFRNSRWVDHIFLEVTRVLRVAMSVCLNQKTYRARANVIRARVLVHRWPTEGHGDGSHTAGPQAAFWDLASRRRHRRHRRRRDSLKRGTHRVPFLSLDRGEEKAQRVRRKKRWLRRVPCPCEKSGRHGCRGARGRRWPRLSPSFQNNRKKKYNGGNSDVNSDLCLTRDTWEWKEAQI